MENVVQVVGFNTEVWASKWHVDQYILPCVHEDDVLNKARTIITEYFTKHKEEQYLIRAGEELDFMYGDALEDTYVFHVPQGSEEEKILTTAMSIIDVQLIREADISDDVRLDREQRQAEWVERMEHGGAYDERGRYDPFA